jgi:hypothetical protein
MGKTVNETIDEWRNDCKKLEEIYNRETTRNNNFHYLIGLPAMLLGLVSGFTLLAESKNPQVITIVAFIGFFSAILTAVQTFIKPVERAEECRGVSAELGGITRELDLIQRFPPNNPDSLKEMLIKINDRITDIKRKAPLVSSDGKPRIQITYDKTPMRAHKEIEQMVNASLDDFMNTKDF